MAKPKIDNIREERITMEVVVDCYNEAERFAGWFCYLEGERVSLLEGIARGERAIKEGRTVSHAAARKRMARWLS